jgi:hypothetical protein
MAQADMDADKMSGAGVGPKPTAANVAAGLSVVMPTVVAETHVFAAARRRRGGWLPAMTVTGFGEKSLESNGLCPTFI